MPANNVILYAQWIPTYTVTYNGNGNDNNAGGGTAPANQTKIYGTDLTLATNTGSLVKTGSNFAGWNTQADGSGTNYTVGATYTGNAALTLYAKWTPITYTVTFNKNNDDATGAMVAQTIASGSSANLTSNAFAKTGFTFAGWATTA